MLNKHRPLKPTPTEYVKSEYLIFAIGIVLVVVMTTMFACNRVIRASSQKQQTTNTH